MQMSQGLSSCEREPFAWVLEVLTRLVPVLPSTSRTGR